MKSRAFICCRSSDRSTSPRSRISSCSLATIEAALETYRAAVDLSRRARHAEGLVQSLRMLGNALLGLARYDEARPCLEEAAQLFAQLEDGVSETEMRTGSLAFSNAARLTPPPRPGTPVLALQRRRGDVGASSTPAKDSRGRCGRRQPDAAMPAFESALALAATHRRASARGRDSERARHPANGSVADMRDALRHYESALALIRGRRQRAVRKP